MKISTKGRYALRIMIDLALHDGSGFVSLKSISERQNISIKYLEQIVSLLQRSGFVKSLRGNCGGYKLTKASQDFRIGEILRAIEGSLAPVSCLDDPENQCPQKEKCYTLPFWTGLQKLIDDYIDSTTLYDLLKNKAPSDDSNFCI